MPLAKIQPFVTGAPTPDGQQLLGSLETGGESAPVPTLILNWPELVKRKK